MSMSTYVYAIVEPDETFLKMKAVWDACKAVNIDVPEEVYEFFDGGKPEIAGKLEPMKVYESTDKDTLQDRYDIIVSEIPKGTTRIRFVNSY